MFDHQVSVHSHSHRSSVHFLTLCHCYTSSFHLLLQKKKIMPKCQNLLLTIWHLHNLWSKKIRNSELKHDVHPLSVLACIPPNAIEYLINKFKFAIESNFVWLKLNCYAAEINMSNNLLSYWNKWIIATWTPVLLKGTHNQQAQLMCEREKWRNVLTIETRMTMQNWEIEWHFVMSSNI